jgi:hypothetical protein
MAQACTGKNTLHTGTYRAAILGALAFTGVTAWSALVLAEFARFSAFTSLTAGGIAGLVVGFLARRNSTAANARPRGHMPHLAAICVALGSLALTLPPGEMLSGGWDPGVYVHTAAAVARGKSLQIPAADLARLDHRQLRTVSRNLHGVHEPYLGMRLLPNGKLSPQFFHLYPSLMAVAYACFGIWGSLCLNSLLNVGCILALYALVGTLYGWRWGIAAALLLAVNPAQVWQAKFQTSEMLAQFFLLAGSALLIRFDDLKRHVTPVLLAGLCYGWALLTRYDTIIFLAPIAILLAWHASRNRDCRRIYAALVAIVLCGGHAWLHMRLVAPYYHPLPGMVAPALAATVALAALAVLWPWIAPAWARRHPAPVGKAIRFLLAAGFLVFVGWAWYVRPRLMMDGRVHHVVAGLLGAVGRENLARRLADGNAWNMHRLASVFSDAGLALGCLGVTWMLGRRANPWVRAWLVSACLVMAVLVTHAFHDHFMMWISRRFVPVIVPLLTVGIIACTQALTTRLAAWSRPVGIAGAASVLGLTLALMTPATHAMAGMRNWPGLADWYRSVDQALPDSAVVFSDQPGFAAPLRFLYGHASYEVNLGAGDAPAALYAWIRSAASAKETDAVVFLSGQGPPEIPGMTATVHSRHPLQSSILQNRTTAVPGQCKGRSGDFVLYRLTRKGNP